MKILLVLALLFVSGCQNMPKDSTENPKPKYNIMDIVYLKLEPSQSVQVLSRDWYNKSGWKYYVRCWDIKDTGYRPTKHHVCEYELIDRIP